MHHLPGFDRELADLPHDQFERAWVGIIGEMMYDAPPAAVLRKLVEVRDRYRRMAAQRTSGGPLDRLRLCRARLSPWAARVIRRLPRTVSDRQAAAIFGCSQSTISRARSGASWYWLDGDRPAA